VTAQDDIAVVAGQLALLTQTVAEMADQLKELRERGENDQSAETSSKSALTSQHESYPM
jgi:hypothetical protein